MAEPDPYADPYSPDRIATRGLTNREVAEGQVRGFFRGMDPAFNPNDPANAPVWLNGPHRSSAHPSGWGAPPDAFDALEQELKRTAKPVLPGPDLPADIPTDRWALPLPDDGSNFTAFKEGIGDTPIAIWLRREQAKSQVDLEMGWKDGRAEPGYDAFNDPQLKDMKDEMWRFWDSQSPQETRLRMIQLVQGAERERRIAANHTQGSSIWRMAGNLVDPSVAVPTTLGLANAANLSRAIRLGTKPAMSWGLLGNAVEGAVVNASTALGTQMWSSSIDAHETLEGVQQLLMITSGIGFGAGGLSAFAKRNHVPDLRPAKVPDGKFRPEGLEPRAPGAATEPGTSVGGSLAKRVDAAEFKLGEKFTDDSGVQWEVKTGSDGKNKFIHVGGELPRGFLDDEKANVVHIDHSTGTERHVGVIGEGREVDANGRPYTTGAVEHRGERVLQLDDFGVKDGRRLDATKVAVGTEAMDYNGVLWRAAARKSVGGAEAGKANLWEFVSQNNRERKGPTRLVDMQFEPGQLPAATGAAAPPTTSPAAAGLADAAAPPMVRLPSKGELDANGRPLPPNFVDERAREHLYMGQGDPAKNASTYAVGQKVMDGDGTIWTVLDHNGTKLFGNAEVNRPLPMASEATGGRGFLETGDEVIPETRVTPQEFAPGHLPDADPAPILDSAPPHPLEAESPNLGKSLSAAVVPGSSTSNLKNLLYMEGLAPTGIGLESLPLSPGFRNMATGSVVVRDITMRLVDPNGVKQNKNIARRMGLIETPPETLAERAAIEKRVKANQQAVTQLEIQKVQGALPEVPPDHVRVWYGGADDPGKVEVQVEGTRKAAVARHGEANVGYVDVPKDTPWLVTDVMGSRPGVLHGIAPAGTAFTPDRVGKTAAEIDGNIGALNRVIEGDRIKLRDPDALARARQELVVDENRLLELRATLDQGPHTPETRKALALEINTVRKQVADAQTRIDDDDLALATGREAPEKSRISVEAWTASRWRPVVSLGEYLMRGDWVTARQEMAGKAVANPMRNGLGGAFLMQGRDFLYGEKTYSFGSFRERVTKALANGHVDRIQDAMSPLVESSSRHLHEAFEKVRIAADSSDVNLFRKEAESSLAKLNERRDAYLEKMKVEGKDPHPDVLGQFEHAETILTKTIKNGPHQSNSVHYVPTIYRQDKVAADMPRLVGIFRDWIVESSARTGNPVEINKATRAAEQAVHKITGTKAQSLADHADELFEEVSNPSGVKVRTMDIPRERIEDFLENDAFMLLRYHVSTMGSAIEMTREFGDINMTKQLGDISADYKRMMDAEPDPRKRIELLRERDRALEDTQTLRDRVLGIEGASKDPHSWTERTIRFLKHYMAWTNMGLSAISQMADYPKVILTEGLDAVYRHGFGALIDNSRKTIIDMANSERMHAGDTLELSTASGAMAFANIGDTFNSRTSVERAANQFSGLYFLANGLTWMTENSRTWSSLSILGNMNAAIMNWGEALSKGKTFADDKTMAKFLSFGMDGNDVLRMYQQLKVHKTDFKSTSMPNTSSWTDDAARELYRQGFARQMNRTVTTRGAFEQPTFMSSSVGSLIAQFKSFGYSAYSKTLVAGLQDNDRQFWIGMATLTGSGILLNEIRNQLFYDKSTFDQPYLGVLADGLERGGGLGILMDANNALEAVTQNKLGMRPMVGAAKHGPVSAEQMASTLLGPSAGKVLLGSKLLGEYMSGDATARTWRQSRGFVPGQNLPWTDWFFDQMFPRGGPKQLIPTNKRLPQGATS